MVSENKFSIVLADPPWLYNDTKGNLPSCGGKTYPVMTLEDIQKIPVAELCDKKSCALFLWATSPKLPEALSVMSAWGFKFVTTVFVWVKTNPTNPKIYSGLGHYTNQNAEFVLLGKKGRLFRKERNVKQIVIAPRGKHSAKPPEVKERIVRLLGDIPRIELFAREKIKDGWSYWGNEVPCDIPENWVDWKSFTIEEREGATVGY